MVGLAFIIIVGIRLITIAKLKSTAVDFLVCYVSYKSSIHCQLFDINPF